MVFSTPASISSERGRRGSSARWWCLLCLMLAGWGSAWAEEFGVRYASTRLFNQVYLLEAQLDLRFSEEALEALDSGVPITVRLDIVVERTRDWWLDETIADLDQRYMLHFHALSDQYLVRNLNSGALYAYPSLGAALEGMGSLRDFPLLDARFVEPDARYDVSLRASLDIEALPAPLRPLAYVTPAWRLESDWYTWSLTP